MKVNNYKSYNSATINEEAPDMGCFAWVLKAQDISCLTCTNSDTAVNESPCLGCGEYANWVSQQVMSKAS
jgi:hypothetical protein